MTAISIWQFRNISKVELDMYMLIFSKCMWHQQFWRYFIILHICVWSHVKYMIISRSSKGFPFNRCNITYLRPFHKGFMRLSPKSHQIVFVYNLAVNYLNKNWFYISFSARSMFGADIVIWCIYRDVAWALWCFKSPKYRLFVQQLEQDNRKKPIKAQHYCFCESQIHRHKGPVMLESVSMPCFQHVKIKRAGSM